MKMTAKTLLSSVAMAAALVCTPLSVMAQTAQAPAAAAEAPRAKNVIIFLADAMGVSALHAASVMAYNEPLKLKVQQWPNLGLSETSPVDNFVSDSANGMSAIMTGVKTRNGVISQGPDVVRGQRDGTPTKTLLEYAEERGLLTGVVSSQSIADATPAAAYAHSNDRGKQGEIFQQAFNPRFGNGVDVLIGAGRERIGGQLAELNTSFETLATTNNRPVYASLEDAPASNLRPIVVADSIDVRVSTLRALDLLEASDNGYLLVVEWDAHTDDVRKGLQNIVDFDLLMADIAQRVDLDETLLIFTADHSFGVQVDGGKRGEDIMEGYDAWKASSERPDVVRLENIMINRTHTGEEVPVLAIGQGADQVRGYFPNTHLFDVAMKAWGWTVQ